MGGNIAVAMSALTDFRRWLWSDWGRPNFLTRMGIPRIVTNFLSFLLFFILFAYLQLRYSSAGDTEKFRLFLRNPFILAAYTALCVAILTREFLSFKYKVKGRTLDKFIPENWSDAFVMVSIAASASMLLLFLIGACIFRSQLK